VAIIYTQTMPEGVPIDMLDAVTEEMGVDADPPAGLVVHVHYEEGGRVRINDVWESLEAQQKFEADRLNPALQKVAAQRGVDLTQMPEPEHSHADVHRMVRGR
jgi:hypothetical protein